MSNEQIPLMAQRGSGPSPYLEEARQRLARDEGRWAQLLGVSLALAAQLGCGSPPPEPTPTVAPVRPSSTPASSTQPPQIAPRPAARRSQLARPERSEPLAPVYGAPETMNRNRPVRPPVVRPPGHPAAFQSERPRRPRDGRKRK